MAVLGRLLVSSAERLDLPDLLSLDSYVAGDWRYFLKGLVGDTKPYILKGFDVIDPGNAIGTQSCSIRVADSITFYPGSNSGSFFHGLQEGHAQAAPLVPELRKNAVNYVYLTFSTYNTSIDTRAFWDPDKDGGAGGEFTQDINTQSVLKVDVNVSTGSFPANTIPIAKITVGLVVITAIEDARDMMFRLGSGGINPNPFNTYAWRTLPGNSFARQEPTTQMLAGGINPFQGADKNILTLKEWMDAVMSKLRELGGTTYWYDDTSSFSIIGGFYDALATAFKSKGKWVHDTVTPGLLTWTEDIQIKLTSDPRTYIIRQGSKTLSDEQVAYLAMVRNKPFNVTDENVSWTNGQIYVNTIGGAVGMFANLAKGDYIKKANDTIEKWVRVEEFYDAINLGGSTTTAASARSIRLNSVYLGITGSEKGRYDKGIYLPADVVTSDRNQAAIGNAGGQFHWIAMRSDTIENIGNAVTTSLSLAIDQHDGSTARVTATAHGLVDGDRITVTGTTNFNGTYKVEVETANIFYISKAGGPFANESGTGRYATITTVARLTPYGLQEESANHGFNTDDHIVLAGTTNYNGTYDISVRSSTQFTVAVSAAAATETTGTASLARIIVRTEGAVAQIIQGQVIDIGGSIADNIRKYIGMDSLSQTAPSYNIPIGYNTLDGMQNYNGIANENLTFRIAKLTAMMADKAQDKTIKLLHSNGIVSISNTVNGSAQELRFSPDGASLTIVTPSSDGQAFVALPGSTTPVSLLINQAAYVQIDRNNPTTTSIVVANIISVPIEENVFVVAVRINTPDIYLWDGSIVVTGSQPAPSYIPTIIQQNQALKLVIGGNWSWSGSVLAWSASAAIQVPGLANTVNLIPAGSITLFAGQVAYVDINRVGPGGSLTVTAALNSTMALGTNRFIIAREASGDVIVGAHSMRLIAGESKKLYAGNSIQNLAFMGAATTADATPQYTSTTIVANNDPLNTAISKLDLAAAASTVSSNQDRLTKLVKGGTWSWNSSTGALAWSSSAFIQTAGLNDTRNEIATSSVTLNADGQVAYVTLNRSGVTPAFLTVSVAAIAAAPVGNNTIIIARRVGTNVIVGNHSMLLVNNESKQLYSGLSDQNSAFIGTTNEGTAAPTYSSDIRGVAAQSLLARIGVNTDAMGDEQENRSAYFYSDSPVTWTGTQLQFTDNIILEVLNTKTGAIKTATILAANSPISLADGQTIYITINRAVTSETVTPVIAATMPAQTQATKDAIPLGRRKDVLGAGYLHLPLHKQVLEAGQTIRLGTSGSGSKSSGTLQPIPGFQWLEVDNYDVIKSATDSKVTSTSYTNATQNIGKSLYAISCDKSRTVATSTGTAFTLNLAPGFTVVAGDVVYLTSGTRSGQWRRIATVTNQTTYILDAAFTGGDATAGNTTMISQAVWSKDLVNLGSSSDKTRARDFFSGNIIKMAVDYGDSLIAADDVADYADTARVVMGASNSGLVSDTGVPTSDTFGNQVFTRAAYPATINNYTLSTNATQARLHVVFFCNPSNASVTTLANVLGYQANFYAEAGSINSGVLESAICFSDASTTAVNCSVSTPSGLTKVALTWSYSPAVNSGGPNGQLEVTVNGQEISRYIGSTQTPTTDLYYTEIADANGIYNTIQFTGNLSLTSVEIKVIKRFGVYDASDTNSAKIAALNEAIVGTTAQVAAGVATHTTLTSALAAVVDGAKILILNNVTITDSPTVNKRVMIEGKGSGSTITGNIIFASAATRSVVIALRIDGNITFNASANKCFMTHCYQSASKTFVNDPTNTDNVFEIITE